MYFHGKVYNSTEGNFDWFMKFYADSWKDAEKTGLPEIGNLIETIPVKNNKPNWNSGVTYNQRKKLL